MNNKTTTLVEPSFNGWKLSNWITNLADNDPQKEKLLWQILQAATTPAIREKVKQAVFIVGAGRTGKSTFTELIINLVGKDNAINLPLADFGNSSKLANVYDKAVIVGDDNDLAHAPNKAYIRGRVWFLSHFSSHHMLIVNPNYKKPFICKSLVIQTGNSLLPKLSKSLARRIVVVKFTHVMPADEVAKHVKSEYIANPELLAWLKAKLATMPAFSEFAETTESKLAKANAIKKQAK